MADILDYVRWRGDLGFDERPFNPVDNVVFSQLSYLPMDGAVPGPGEGGRASVAELAKWRAVEAGAAIDAGRGALKDIMVEAASEVLREIGAAPRYRDCALFDYVSQTDPSEEKQFSAYCAEIGANGASKRLLVVFRGTDTSLVGWKEDLNMGFLNTVPAQKEAAARLEQAALSRPWPIVLAGHSKGGNLAVYAAAFSSGAVRQRIEAVYSNDAPGFRPEVIRSEGYREILPRLRSFVPQSSFVGMLLERGDVPEVVRSSASGLLQHNMMSWEVARDSLAPGGELTALARLASGIVREWIGKIGEERSQMFIEAIYKILAATNASSFLDLSSNWSQAAAGIITGLKNVDGPTKKLMRETLAELFRAARASLTEKLRRKSGGEGWWDKDLFSEE